MTGWPGMLRATASSGRWRGGHIPLAPSIPRTATRSRIRSTGGCAAPRRLRQRPLQFPLCRAGQLLGYGGLLRDRPHPSRPRPPRALGQCLAARRAAPPRSPRGGLHPSPFAPRVAGQCCVVQLSRLQGRHRSSKARGSPTVRWIAPLIARKGPAHRSESRRIPLPEDLSQVRQTPASCPAKSPTATTCPRGICRPSRPTS